ncbi:nuclear pore complex protein DDB_G0274915 [Octopus bimaculoides]|uniref:Uncharacterized protein n=1 Tax=Octopus bimaculoides TaxID=37653 RepID=A0A0L8GY96_OCTBM|nr:nuclear pore complex protein DDB_G0274915 [Octopus bimaculoides]XP_014777132.1 nuclear pore complex protein DDB_G0274915 [Octopus bimaculoides]|eukprot:XP_014777131.1 PREDICTED: nuclear pore complex protein DDB_G0274915-like [Octopus bimaculoides]
MIDVSGRQLQSLYPSSRTVGRGGYQSQERLTPVTSVAATSSTAVAMIGCAQSLGRETAPSKALNFPYQHVQQSLQKDLDESRLQNPLLSQLPWQQGDVSGHGTFQSPLHCSKQQEAQICDQLSSSRCPAQLDRVTSSEVSSSAVDNACSAVSSNPASHQLYSDLKVSCPSSVSQLLPFLTATSVSPTSSSLLIFSSSSSSSSQQQQQVHRKHSSPNHHQSGNSHGLQLQPHHRQQLPQQKLAAHKKNLSFLSQPYHFQPSPTSTSSVPVTEDSSCSGMLSSCTSNNSMSSINSSTCGSGDGNGVDVSSHGLSDSCGNTGHTVAYITDKLWNQMVLDSGSPQQRSQREHQKSSMLSSADMGKSYSSPSKPSASVTNTEPDPWKIKTCHSECTGLNATLQSMLSLKLGDNLEKKKVYQTLPPSGACTRQSSCLSAPILSHSASSSHISEGLRTRGYGSSLSSDCSVSNSTDIPLTTGDVGSDNDTIKDTSPGTPPYPPKKKHCRSLSIPSESGSQKPYISAPINSSNYFVALELSPRNSGSLLKPVAFNPVTEDSWSQYQQSFISAEGESVSEVSGISSSTSFSSLTNHPAVFSGAVHWPTTADPSSISPKTQQTFTAVLDPISCSTQLNKSVTLLHTPPESPVPRPASVSIVGYRDDDDVENRAFKPVSDMQTGHGYNNSGFSSPSSCSSPSSFPLQPRPHPTTVTSQATGSSCFLTMPLPKAYASSPFATPVAAATSSSPSSSPVKLATTSCSLPPHTPFWSFQKHRSLSLEDQCSISNSTSPSSFSPSSSILSSPSHPPHHPHHYPSHTHYPHSRQQQVLPLPHPPPPQIIPTQRLMPPQQQQQQQLGKTVSASGSTPSVPAACKTSVSNPSSPRRQRIPRCRSQPCVLHDRKAGVKRRRDYDRPTLDFHKMTQTAYGNSTCQTEASEQILQNLYQGPKVSWFQQFPEDQMTIVKPNLNPMSVSEPVSIEVLRSTCLLPDDHTDDIMSEDAEISAATEAGEAAARAAAAAEKPTADECCPNSLHNIRQNNSDDGCSRWDDASFERPFISSRSVGPAGWDPLVYVSDESNPSFCGCDDDDDDDDDEDQMTENEDYYGRDKPPIADLDVDQIENH